MVVVGGPVVHALTASEIQQQIDALNQQNSQTQQSVNQLNIEADSYEDAIYKLDARISVLRREIVSNQNKQAEIQRQIEAAEAELTQQKQILGENIKAMYLEGDISTLEILASSNDLSDFVDKQQYRNTVQSKVKNTVDKIATLKAQLLEQKNAIDRLLKEQTTLNDQLIADQQQQSEMLAYTEGRKASFNQQIKENNSRISDLRRQQIILNSRNSIGGRVGNANNGYYPYAGWPFSMSLGPGCVDGDGPDRWGYCTRQCVSYAAWAVERSGRDAPMYYGDANNWDNAGSRYKVGSPEPGDVAVDNGGTWGHVMYVEAVGEKNGRPAIYVSQYNAGLNGEYSEEWKYASGYVYLRFP